jgi:hypothetical protein
MANKSVGLLTIAFGADLRGFDKAMKKAQRSIKKFGTSMQRTGKNLTRSLTLPLAAFAAASVKAFDEQIVAETKLLTALKGREDIQQRLIAQAKELQTKTLFGDEETIKAQALLASLGLTEDQITMLIPQIQNMATGLTMDLVSATSLVSKSVSTTTDALARYFNTGLKGVTGQQERAIVLTQSLSEKFEGQAEAIRDKGLGAFKALGMAIGDVGEEFGEIITEQLQPLTEGFEKLTKIISGLTKEQKENIVFYAKILAAVGPVITILGILAASLSAIIGFFAAMSASTIAVVLSAIGVAAMFVTDKFREFKNSKKHVDDFTSSVKELKKITDELGEPSLLFDPSGKKPKKFSTFGNIKVTGDDDEEKKVETRIAGITKKIESLKPVLLDTGRAWRTYYEEREESSTMAAEAQKQLNAATQLFGDVMFSAMMNAANGQESFFSSFIENMKKAIKQLLIQLAVMTAINFLLGGTGVAGSLKGAFGAAKEGILGLATGGLVTGPTMALVGEGAGTTASNPEVVAPLDKLKGMINGGGSQQVEVYGRISGNDIFISNQRGSLNRQRSV